jgi:AraC-like DNA-binding protein
MMQMENIDAYLDIFDLPEGPNIANAEKSSTPPDFFSPQVQEARRFYLDLAPPADSPLAVVCGGCESCLPDYAIARKTFPFYGIEFVARGKGSLTLGGQEYALKAGSVFSYGPDVSQHITTDADDLLLKYFVDFTGLRAPQLLQQCELAPGTVAYVYAPADIQSILDLLIQDGLKGTGFAATLCAALLDYLVVKLAESRMPWQARQTPAFATYQRCRQHITENRDRLASLEQIARECHVDRAYLCRLFRRYDHQTPYQFLMRLKMNLAAERLQDPGILVKQVAAELGFGDPFHFSRAFKSVFGLSPDAFRRLR